MKKKIWLLLFMCLTSQGFAQTARDIFTTSDYEFTWLGIDYSQVKLIGDFSQFSGAGGVSPYSMKSRYFPAWNNLVINERSKYNIQGALRKSNLQYDISEVTVKNAEAALENMEVYNAPNYNQQKIQEMVNGYSFVGKKGVGILFVAECLNKASEEAYYHVVLINMMTKEILVYERIRSTPAGIGLRNYWAGSIYSVIKTIDKNYKSWKARYK
ncbi:MAG: hypothetical protein JWO58_463 [Chitinophagaceae bacterium]|nr:hypothetical protein [Chitinophagaceae bacterium]